MEDIDLSSDSLPLFFCGLLRLLISSKSLQTARRCSVASRTASDARTKPITYR
jgi:hypothetical protein